MQKKLPSLRAVPNFCILQILCIFYMLFHQQQQPMLIYSLIQNYLQKNGSDDPITGLGLRFYLAHTAQQFNMHLYTTNHTLRIGLGLTALVAMNLFFFPKAVNGVNALSEKLHLNVITNKHIVSTAQFLRDMVCGLGVAAVTQLPSELLIHGIAEKMQTTIFKRALSYFDPKELINAMRALQPQLPLEQMFLLERTVAHIKNYCNIPADQTTLMQALNNLPALATVHDTNENQNVPAPTLSTDSLGDSDTHSDPAVTVQQPQLPLQSGAA